MVAAVVVNVMPVDIPDALKVNTSWLETENTTYVPFGRVEPPVSPAMVTLSPATSPCSRTFIVTAVFGLAVLSELAERIGLPLGYHSKACCPSRNSMTLSNA